MKALAVGSKIWFKTVFLNAFFYAIVALFFTKWYDILFSFILLIGGFVVTLPLLLIIVPLIELSVKIPYNVKARIAWLTFYLLLIIIGFYAFVIISFHLSINSQSEWPLLMGTTIAALLVAVLTTRRSLNKLYNQHDEAAQLQNVLNIINT